MCIKLCIIRLLFTLLWYVRVKETYLHTIIDCYKKYFSLLSILNVKKKMPKSLIMKALKEILVNKDIIQKVRDLNFDKEVQVKYEIHQLEARKD